MKDRRFKRVLCLRRAFQMTAASVILVLIISIVIVMTTGDPITNDDCGPVQNMAIAETSTLLIVTWEKSPDLGCNANNLFQIDCTKNGEVIYNGKFVNALRLEIEKDSCKEYVITVWSLLPNGAAASATPLTFFSSIAGTGQVLNLQYNNNKLQWDIPENSEDCNLQYQVDVEPKNFDPKQITTNDVSVDLTLIPCTENDILVTSIVRETNTKGLKAGIQHAGPVSRLAPTHSTTNPTPSGALVTWREVEEENNCEIKSIEFSYFLTGTGDEPSRIQFPLEASGTYRLTGLPQNTKYSYTARWLLEENAGEESDKVFFKTASLSPPSSIHSIRTDEDVVIIEWVQDYDVDYITKHSVVVENLGPEHFVPKECLIGEGEIYKYEAVKGTNYVIFYQARSNFKYQVRVTTHFDDLGLTISEEDEVIVPMTVPDNLQEITSVYSYENSVEYKVTSQIDWTIPCDINGPISHFEVIISGSTNVAGVAGSCSVNFLSQTVPGDVEEVFGLTTNLLVPYFEYTIDIKTILVHTPELSTKTIKKLAALPNPYTPPT